MYLFNKKPTTPAEKRALKGGAQEKQRREDIKKVEPYIGPVSLYDFERYVVPLVTDDPEVQEMNRTFVSDSKLPSSAIASLSSAHFWGKFTAGAMAVPIPWFLGLFSVLFMTSAKKCANVHAFNKWVILCGVGIGIPVFPLVYSWFTKFEHMFIDHALFTNKNNEQLSLYRRRLLENCPRYANLKYLDETELVLFDGAIQEDKIEEYESLEDS